MLFLGGDSVNLFGGDLARLKTFNKTGYFVDGLGKVAELLLVGEMRGGVGAEVVQRVVGAFLHLGDLLGGRVGKVREIGGVGRVEGRELGGIDASLPEHGVERVLVQGGGPAEGGWQWGQIWKCGRLSLDISIGGYNLSNHGFA